MATSAVIIYKSQNLLKLCRVSHDAAPENLGVFLFCQKHSETIKEITDHNYSFISLEEPATIMSRALEENDFFPVCNVDADFMLDERDLKGKVFDLDELLRLCRSPLLEELWSFCFNYGAKFVKEGFDFVYVFDADKWKAENDRHNDWFQKSRVAWSVIMSGEEIDKERNLLNNIVEYKLSEYLKNADIQNF